MLGVNLSSVDPMDTVLEQLIHPKKNSQVVTTNTTVNLYHASQSQQISMHKRKLMATTMSNGVGVGTSSNYRPIAEKTQALLSYSQKHPNHPPINGPSGTSSN